MRLRMEPHVRSKGQRWVWSWLVCGGLAGSGCEADDKMPPQEGLSDAGSAVEAGRQPDAAQDCAEHQQGETCGRDMYCIDGLCQIGECGDGVVTGNEACDDGNEQLGDGCRPNCELESSGCGNAVVDPGEECDDGNLLDQDACSNRCTVQECGNERVDFGEECDDGNRVDDDPCSNKCQVVACRNGRLDPGEQCDDGNTVDVGDNCTNDCKTVICGNGKVEEYESCDDGNQRDGDACPSTCVSAVCGNGQSERGEVCDGPELVVTQHPDQTHTAAYRSCSADCKKWLKDDEDPCLACQQTACTSYEGIDLVGGCYTTVNEMFGADATDDAFTGQCIDIMSCALKSNCWLDPVTGGTGCYCGAVSPDDCNAKGPADTAPCLNEWFEGSRASNNQEVQARFSDFAFPTAWAFFLLECYRTKCADVCSWSSAAP